MTWEGLGGEQESEAFFGAFDILDDFVDDFWYSADEGFFLETCEWVIEHPSALVLVGMDDENGVHNHFGLILTQQ